DAVLHRGAGAPGDEFTAGNQRRHSGQDETVRDAQPVSRMSHGAGLLCAPPFGFAFFAGAPFAAPASLNASHWLSRRAISSDFVFTRLSICISRSSILWIYSSGLF